MPLVHVHLVKGKPAKYIKAVCDGIHTALKTAWGVSDNDRSQLVSEYKNTHFHFDKTFWGVKQSKDVIVIHITSISHSAAMKKKLYRELVKILCENPKVRKEDIFVTIVEDTREDWSFGNGVTQLTDSV